MSNGLNYITFEDFEDVNAWDGENGFQLVAPGDYEVEIVKVETKMSSKGNNMHEVTFQVAANADGSESDQTGLECRNWYVIEGKGRGRLKNFLLATGAFDGKGYSPDDLVGRRLLITVIHEPYTKTDPLTGEETTRESAKVLKERALPEAEPKKAVQKRPAGRVANGRPQAQQ